MNVTIQWRQQLLAGYENAFLPEADSFYKTGLMEITKIEVYLQRYQNLVRTRSSFMDTASLLRSESSSGVFVMVCRPL